MDITWQEELKKAFITGYNSAWSDWENAEDAWDEYIASELDLTPIWALHMPVRVLNACERNGVKTVGQLRRVVDWDNPEANVEHMINWQNIGWKSVQHAVVALRLFDRKNGKS